MKLIKTEDAVGYVLCHDLTQIIKGVTKDAVFRKGHILREEDIPVLLSIGKDNLYVWEADENMLHENEAAVILCEMCENEGMVRSKDIKEGKIELSAAYDGLFKVDTLRLEQINGFGQMMIATRHGNFPVKAGDKLAGMRIIPLVIEKEKMAAVRELCGPKPLLELLPIKKKKCAIIATGNEIFYGRIQDTFTPVIEEKLREFGCEMIEHITVDDNNDKITEAIKTCLDKGCEMVFCSGGMSVDPDDKTPLAIRSAGANVVSYGAPVLPGAMFMVAYMPDGRPVCGLPGCVMYSKRTIFDLCLPYLVTDVKITPEFLAGLGNGGLCLNCPVCHFPNCGFGKGR